MSAKRIASAFYLVLLLLSWSVSAAPILRIQKWVTKSGTTVLYVHEKDLPIVDIQVVFDAGSARDLVGKSGIAKITNDSLIAGTQTKTADQVAIAFDNVGALFSSAVNRDMAVVALRSLSDPKYLQPAFAAFTEVLAKPTFPENEFRRIQKQTLSALTEQDQSPSSIATKAFYSAVYNSNPYGHPIAGTPATITQLSAQDLRDFHKNYYTAQNALIAIVGSLDQQQAQQMAETISSQLNQGQRLNNLVFKPVDRNQLLEHVSFPSSQTHVIIGQAGINRKDPAYFPLMVGNYILGGGSLTSRLFDEVREKRGLVYSVRSQFLALKDKGPFAIELQTRNSEANNAIHVVNTTLSNFISKGPTADELLSAKKNLTQGFILRLASNSAIAGQLIAIGYYDLPLNYLDTYQSNVNNVSSDQVKSAFQQLIHPDHLVTVTVGSSPNGQSSQTAS